VRALSVVDGARALHTVGMANTKGATAFVTGAGGFIGTELIKVLRAGGHHVLGLAESEGDAQRVIRAGAVPVMGRLVEPGRWQDEAAADWVFHLSSHAECGARTTRKHAEALGRARLSMDAHLLDAVAAGATRKIVYLAHTGFYGATGQRPITEDEPCLPSAWGSSFAPALDRLEGYVAAGLPIVTAFSAWVYGNASWFCERVVEPVTSRRRVLQFGNPGPRVSVIHVEDCARALVHLAERGESGGRYFVVNTDPVRLDELARTFARLAGRPLRVWRVPAAATRLLVGPVLAEYLQADAVFSNIRLRGTGFQFRYPTLEDGLRQVMGAGHE
jgi:uncharacterized protein